MVSRGAMGIIIPCWRGCGRSHGARPQGSFSAPASPARSRREDPRGSQRPRRVEEPPRRPRAPVAAGPGLLAPPEPVGRKDRRRAAVPQERHARLRAAAFRDALEPRLERQEPRVERLARGPRPRSRPRSPRPRGRRGPDQMRRRLSTWPRQPSARPRSRATERHVAALPQDHPQELARSGGDGPRQLELVDVKGRRQGELLPSRAEV
jgi:hypothetical protein